jgi:hypothetical protein
MFCLGIHQRVLAFRIATVKSLMNPAEPLLAVSPGCPLPLRIARAVTSLASLGRWWATRRRNGDLHNMILDCVQNQFADRVQVQLTSFPLFSRLSSDEWALLCCFCPRPIAEHLPVREVSSPAKPTAPRLLAGFDPGIRQDLFHRPGE